MTTYVTVPLFYTGHEGWLDAETSIVVGGSALVADINRRSANHLSVCDYPDESSPSQIKSLISEGMKSAHQQAQAFMVEEFGDDWRSRASYRFGDLEYHEEA